MTQTPLYMGRSTVVAASSNAAASRVAETGALDEMNKIVDGSEYQSILKQKLREEKSHLPAR